MLSVLYWTTSSTNYWTSVVVITCDSEVMSIFNTSEWASEWASENDAVAMNVNINIFNCVEYWTPLTCFIVYTHNANNKRHD